MIDSENYIETQSKILTSETLALQTIRNSGLVGAAAICFAQRAVGSCRHRKLWRIRSGRRNWRVSRQLKRAARANSRLMDVSFESTDPQLASRIVNAHIETYVQRNFQSQFDSTTRATTWLRDQLDELKMRVQKSEDARIAYERQEPDLDARRQTEHDHPAVCRCQPRVDRRANRAGKEAGGV